ncbi:hypothetical protein [Silvibacterium sp.]|uniref:hypothetical protein n=1 Tax=Silvibacterium sp. TaxID=1964179 RepID=UPI0039E3F12F
MRRHRTHLCQKRLLQICPLQICLLALLLPWLCGLPLYGQLNSSTSSVTLSATMGESLTVAATPSSVSFVLLPGGVALGAVPVVITTTWVLSSSRANVVLDAYFTSSTQALISGTTKIPPSEVLGQVLTGTPVTYTAFTGTGALGPAGAELTLFTQPITVLNYSALRVDTLTLEVNLGSQTQLPAGTYTGTLTLAAQAL